MTPPYSVHTTPADTTHAKASAAKRLRSNAHVATKLSMSIGWPENGFGEVGERGSGRFVGQPEVMMHFGSPGIAS